MNVVALEKMKEYFSLPLINFYIRYYFDIKNNDVIDDKSLAKAIITPDSKVTTCVLGRLPLIFPNSLQYKKYPECFEVTPINENGGTFNTALAYLELTQAELRFLIHMRYYQKKDHRNSVSVVEKLNVLLSGQSITEQFLFKNDQIEIEIEKQKEVKSP
jgi:hypothetical protein